MRFRLDHHEEAESDEEGEDGREAGVKSTSEEAKHTKASETGECSDDLHVIDEAEF